MHFVKPIMQQNWKENVQLRGFNTTADKIELCMMIGPLILRASREMKIIVFIERILRKGLNRKESQKKQPRRLVGYADILNLCEKRR